MTVFELRRENMSHVGGPAGSEYTTVDWTMLFKNQTKAMKEAQRDLKQDFDRDTNLAWKSDGKRMVCDCGPVMYTITKKQVLG